MSMNATARSLDSSVLVLDPLASEARDCLRQQAEAIAKLSSRVDETFGEAVRLLHRTSGHVTVLGLGKSGLVGRKIAATLASTGTPSFFVHAAEALHGDLGMVTADDAAILISYSGKTEEVLNLLPYLKRLRVPTIGLVGDSDSALAQEVDVALDVGVDGEVCPNNLAPTSSTLATLAMGDALAVSLSRLRGFRRADFANLHPAGSLGKRFAHVRDLMTCEGLVKVEPNASCTECLLSLAGSNVPLALVVSRGKLVGTVSTAELASAMSATVRGLDRPVRNVMNTDPTVVHESDRLADVKSLRDGSSGPAVVVNDAAQVVGVLLD